MRTGGQYQTCLDRDLTRMTNRANFIYAPGEILVPRLPENASGRADKNNAMQN